MYTLYVLSLAESRPSPARPRLGSQALTAFEKKYFHPPQASCLFCYLFRYIIFAMQGSLLTSDGSGDRWGVDDSRVIYLLSFGLAAYHHHHTTLCRHWLTAVSGTLAEPKFCMRHPGPSCTCAGLLLASTACAPVPFSAHFIHDELDMHMQRQALTRYHLHYNDTHARYIIVYSCQHFDHKRCGCLRIAFFGQRAA